MESGNDFHPSIIKESDLLKKLALGEKDAFNILYRNYQPKVYSYLLPFLQNSVHNPNEIIQDVFVQMWLKRTMLSEIQSLEHYLYRMARNRLVDIKRGNKAAAMHKKKYLQNSSVTHNETELHLLYREFSKISIKAIECLPERRRKIFDLNIGMGLSTDEIAALLNISKEVAKKQLYKASSFVRAFIKKNQHLIVLYIIS